MQASYTDALDYSTRLAAVVETCSREALCPEIALNAEVPPARFGGGW